MELQEIFNTTTVIKPAPKSSKLFRTDVENSITNATKNYTAKNEYGEDVTKKSVPYTDERFSGTKQVFGVRWNYNRKRFNIIDPSDITKKRYLETNSEILNKLVVKCRLVNDRKDHPNFGKFITEADIHDRKDPFFTHSSTRFSLIAGQAHMQTALTSPLNVIILLGWLARRDFQLGSGKRSGIRGTQVKYIVIDTEIERIQKQKIKDQDKEARKIYEALDPPKKLKLAMALGMVSSLNIDDNIVDDYIYEYATDRVTLVKKVNKTKQQIFLELVQSGKENINAHYAFYLGKTKGIIRNQNKTYQAFGRSLGATINDCVTVIRSDNNNLYQDILEACEAKKV